MARKAERGLIWKDHTPSLAQIRRALDHKNSVIEEAKKGRKKAIFKDRDCYGKMKHWALIFIQRQRLLRENEALGAHLRTRPKEAKRVHSVSPRGLQNKYRCL